MRCSIALINPKFVYNVAAALRAAACFGADDLTYTGKRVDLSKMVRTPREFRMKDYKEVKLHHIEDAYLQKQEWVVPVAIEIVPGAQNLAGFEHPDNALYIFGPEDGSLPQKYRRMCHSFVYIPTRFCMNLSSAVYVTLYDRLVKQGADHVAPPGVNRAWADYDMAEVSL